MAFNHGPLSLSFDESSPAAAESFSADSSAPPASRVGVLLIHGFTGSPVSVSRWARVLADEGFSVRLPVLPGHATSPGDLARRHRSEWVRAVDEAWDELAESCAHIVVAGISMGGALALHAAARHRAPAVVVNPAVVLDKRGAALAPVLRFAVPFIDAIGDDIARKGVSERAYAKTPVAGVAQLRALLRETRALLPRLTRPVLAFVSRTDHVVSPRSRRALDRALAGAETSQGQSLLRMVPLERSYHVATMDYDADLIFEQSVEFIRATTNGG